MSDNTESSALLIFAALSKRGEGSLELARSPFFHSHQHLLSSHILSHPLETSFLHLHQTCITRVYCSSNPGSAHPLYSALSSLCRHLIRPPHPLQHPTLQATAAQRVGTSRSQAPHWSAACLDFVRGRRCPRPTTTVALLPFTVCWDRAFLSTTTVMDYTGGGREAQHLCVLVHGYVMTPLCISTVTVVQHADKAIAYGETQTI